MPRIKSLLGRAAARALAVLPLPAGVAASAGSGWAGQCVVSRGGCRPASKYSAKGASTQSLPYGGGTPCVYSPSTWTRLTTDSRWLFTCFVLDTNDFPMRLAVAQAGSRRPRRRLLHKAGHPA